MVSFTAILDNMLVLFALKKTVSVPGGHGIDVARRRDMIQPPLGTPGTVEKLAIVFNFIRDSIFC